MARALFAVVVSVVALFVSLALLVTGSTLLGTLSAVRMGLEGMPATTIGLVMAGHAIGFVTGTIYAVSVIRRVGHIRAFAAFAAMACAVTLAHPLHVDAALWFGLRVVLGFSVAGMLMVVESWISGRATSDNRGALLGAYTFNFYLASAAGQFLFALAEPVSFVPFSVVAMLMVLSLVPLCLTDAQVPVLNTSGARLRFRELIAASPSGVSAALTGGVVLGAFLAMGPVYALRVGIEGGELAAYMGIASLSAMLMQWPAGWASDIYGRRRVLVGLAALGALAAALVALFGATFVPGLFVLTGVMVAAGASLYPVGLANANDHLHSDHAVAASSGMLRCYGIGTIIGPIAGAVVMGLLGPAGLFAFLGVCLLLLALLVYYRVSYIPGVPLAEQGDYVSVTPVSTPVIITLDPRNEDFEQWQPTAGVEDHDVADALELGEVSPDTDDDGDHSR